MERLPDNHRLIRLHSSPFCLPLYEEEEEEKDGDELHGHTQSQPTHTHTDDVILIPLSYKINTKTVPKSENIYFLKGQKELQTKAFKDLFRRLSN